MGSLRLLLLRTPAEVSLPQGVPEALAAAGSMNLPLEVAPNRLLLLRPISPRAQLEDTEDSVGGLCVVRRDDMPHPWSLSLLRDDVTHSSEEPRPETQGWTEER